MEVCHEVKVEVMHYLDEVAAQLHYLTPAEREQILQQLYARISHALERVRHGQPTVRDLQQVLASLPSPRSFARQEAKAAEPAPDTLRGVHTAVAGAVLMPFALILFGSALVLASGTAAAKLTSWEWVVMLVGFQAPILVTMLGIASIAGLRATHAGRGNLALAVSVMLTFPLLLLDGSLIYLASVGLRHYWHDSRLIPLLVFLVIFMLDMQIIRSVWQTANRRIAEMGELDF